MTASFTAYIDESGDEGFKFLENNTGSSRWFVLSAVIFRSSNLLAPTEALKRSRELLKKEQKKALHFRELRHEQRTAYVSEICKERFRIVSVLVYKPGINEPERYQSGKFLLYKYAARLLLERVSWLCRDTKITDEGDGTVDLVFSDRTAMSYESLRKYLEALQNQSANNDRVRVCWDVVVPSRIRAVQHSQLAGLQIADAVASSAFFAAQLGTYGLTEPRYLTMLLPKFYSHEKTRIGYGLKFWPDIQSLQKEMPHMAAFL